jgi:hypothetical protein
VDLGQPTPEAPRTILDVLAVTRRLPLHLQAKGEFEYVGRKPLGTGCDPDPNAQCTGTAVREFHLAVARPFDDGRFNVGVNALLASGLPGRRSKAFILPMYRRSSAFVFRAMPA